MTCSKDGICVEGAFSGPDANPLVPDFSNTLADDTIKFDPFLNTAELLNSSETGSSIVNLFDSMLQPFTVSQSVSAHPALEMSLVLVAGVLEEVVAVPQGTGYAACKKGQQPSAGQLCEPGANAHWPGVGDISSSILSCIHMECIDRGCAGHAFSISGIRSCNVNTWAPVGTIYQLRFTVFTPRLVREHHITQPGSEMFTGEVVRTIVIVSACPQNQQLCGAQCTSLNCDVLDNVMRDIQSRAPPARPSKVYLKLLPDHGTIRLTAGTEASFSLEPCSTYALSGVHRQCGAVATALASDNTTELNFSSYISVSQVPACDRMSDAAGVCNMCDAKMAVTGRCQPGKYTLAYGLPSWVDAAEPYKERQVIVENCGEIGIQASIQQRISTAQRLMRAGGIQAGQMPSDTSSAVSFAMALAMNSILAAHLSLRNHATGAEDIFSQVEESDVRITKVYSSSCNMIVCGWQVEIRVPVCTSASDLEIGLDIAQFMASSAVERRASSLLHVPKTPLDSLLQMLRNSLETESKCLEVAASYGNASIGISATKCSHMVTVSGLLRNASARRGIELSLVSLSGISARSKTGSESVSAMGDSANGAVGNFSTTQLLGRVELQINTIFLQQLRSIETARLIASDYYRRYLESDALQLDISGLSSHLESMLYNAQAWIDLLEAQLIDHLQKSATSEEFSGQVSRSVSLDRLERLQTHHALATSLTTGVCNGHNETKDATRMHASRAILSFHIDTLQKGNGTNQQRQHPKVQSIGSARLSSRVVGGLLLQAERLSSGCRQSSAPVSGWARRFGKLRNIVSTTVPPDDESYGRNPVLIPFTKSYVEETAISVMNSNASSQYPMENPQIAQNIFHPVPLLSGFPRGHPLLVSTQLTVDDLLKALTWIDEAGYVDGRANMIRAFVLVRNSDLSATACAQLQFRFPANGKVKCHAKFGGTFSVGFCRNQVYDVPLMMKQTVFNMVFISLLAAHMWWLVRRMGDKRRSSSAATMSQNSRHAKDSADFVQSA